MKKCTSFEKQKGARYIRGKVYFDIIVFSGSSSTKLSLRFLLIWFAREIKGFYQSSLGNEVNFRDIMNVSPNVLAKSWNFKKTETRLCSFVDERAVITTTLISFCHWKTLVPFCLWKKRPENAFLTITVNYGKIATDLSAKRLIITAVQQIKSNYMEDRNALSKNPRIP